MGAHQDKARSQGKESGKPRLAVLGPSRNTDSPCSRNSEGIGGGSPRQRRHTSQSLAICCLKIGLRAVISPCGTVEPMIPAQKSAALLPFRSKKATATPPLPVALEAAIAPEDPFIDVKSPRNDRNIRVIHKVAHTSTPIEPQPLVTTLPRRSR